MATRSNLQEFIKKSQKIHGNIYKYDFFIYKNCKTKSLITCYIHGNFEQNANNHMQGQGCPLCKNERIAKSNSKYNLQTFIKKAKQIHKNKYDYSKVIYQEVKKKIEIICKIHNKSFYQTVEGHLIGYGCRLCGIDKYKNKKKIGLSEFKKMANKKHNYKYNYSLIKHYENNTQIIDIICKKHPDKVFKKDVANHLRGQGCPLCSASKGEEIIRKFLKKNKIIFEQQKTFDGCKLKHKLRFDFYLPLLNTIIEFNGMQHYQEIKYFHKNPKFNFNNQKKRDKIKRNFAINKKIRLIEIPYWNIHEIENILKREFNL